MIHKGSEIAIETDANTIEAIAFPLPPLQNTQERIDKAKRITPTIVPMTLSGKPSNGTKPKNATIRLIIVKIKVTTLRVFAQFLPEDTFLSIENSFSNIRINFTPPRLCKSRCLCKSS